MNIEVSHLTNPGGPGFSEATVEYLRARDGVARVDAQNKNAAGRYADVLVYFRTREDREEFAETAAAVGRDDAAGTF